MKPKSKKIFVAASLLAAISTVLFSFSSPMGGDSFEIYLNNKRVLQQFVHEAKDVQTLTWSQSNYNDKVDIYYSHCGVTGKGRSIVIKDAQNKILKKWEFADAAENKNSKTMSCKVKDILNAGKNNTIYLYYSSRELPKGHLLATIKGS